jgi:hypothetical protein
VGGDSELTGIVTDACWTVDPFAGSDIDGREFVASLNGVLPSLGGTACTTWVTWAQTRFQASDIM